MAHHPDLRAARFLPRAVLTGPRSLRVARLLERLVGLRPGGDADDVVVQDGVSVRVHRPTGSGPWPALLWLHGGGLVGGSARQDDPFCSRVARELGAVVAAVDYRRAPEHPFPVPLEDCYAALLWLARQPGVDPARIAVGGASAGGGLAAAVALLARDRGDVRPVLQLLVYPMLDDRTTLRRDVDERPLRLWDQRANRFGWNSYLQGAAGAEDVPPLAAPARCEDLTGLPPAWIGVGTVDLFHDEDLAYAHRLREAGVPCELHVVPGAYHGFDAVERRTPVAEEFAGSQLHALAVAWRG